MQKLTTLLAALALMGLAAAAQACPGSASYNEAKVPPPPGASS
jgi:hypothetical protein